jgi:hypothetical protein
MQLVRFPKGPIVGLINVAGSVRVEQAIFEDLILIRRLPRGLDSKRGGSRLDRRSMNSVHAVQERDSTPTKRKSSSEPTRVWNVFAEFRGENREMRHAGGADVFVSQVQRF